MSHLVADDILDVLFEIQRRFRATGAIAGITELRRDAATFVAMRELNAKRFSSEVSAKNSIDDARSLRLVG